MKILGLDISSSTIGFGILDKDANLIKYGHLKPLKKNKADKNNLGYTARLADAYNLIIDLLEKENPDIIIIEDYAKKFSVGKSTANTIIVLATFNEAVSLACYHSLGIEPIKYPVRTMRSRVGKYFNIELKSKDDVFPFISEKYKNFKITKTRHGNIKKEHFDEADAIFVALSHIVMEN